MAEFKKYLCDSGFKNTALWLKEFEKLGVTSKTDLEHLEGDTDSFLKLKEKANHLEKIILLKLLKIDIKKLEQDEKELKEEKNKDKKESDEMLKKLEEKRLKEKERRNEELQKQYDAVREEINVTPKSSDHTDLKELLIKHHENMKLSGQLQSRNSLSDSMLLQSVSGGQALHGVLKTEDTEDLLKDRDCLLKLPEDVSLTMLPHAETKRKEFSSIHQEGTFKKSVNVLGFGAGASCSFPVKAAKVSLGGGFSNRKENETTDQHCERETYSSTVNFSTIQIARYSFNNKDLKLSDSAHESLCCLLQLLERHGPHEVKVEKACREFFRTYGSHANKGPLSFGGSFWLTCSSSGFSEEDRHKVKNLQSFAISGDVGVSVADFGVSVGFNFEKTKAKYKETFSQNVVARTSLQMEVCGGPQEATNVSQWMDGIVANNSLWIITDRGGYEKLIPVWDIISKNHKELRELRNVLQSTWEKMSGLKAEEDYVSKFVQ